MRPCSSGLWNEETQGVMSIGCQVPGLQGRIETKKALHRVASTIYSCLGNGPNTQHIKVYDVLMFFMPVAFPSFTFLFRVQHGVVRVCLYFSRSRKGLIAVHLFVTSVSLMDVDCLCFAQRIQIDVLLFYRSGFDDPPDIPLVRRFVR